MKVKQYVYITGIENFLQGGNYPRTFTLEPDDSYEGEIDGWFLAGEVEFEVNTNEKKIRQSAVAAIDAAEQKERAEHEVKMNMLAEKKQNLLAITHEVTG